MTSASPPRPGGEGRRLKQLPPAVVPVFIEHAETLTQYGVVHDRPPFHPGPRPQDRGELSMLRGCLTAEEAAPIVRNREADPWDRVRCTKARTLRINEFDVEHTPKRGNKIHVSVSLPDKPHVWNSAMMEKFAHAFAL